MRSNGSVRDTAGSHLQPEVGPRALSSGCFGGTPAILVLVVAALGLFIPIREAGCGTYAEALASGSWPNASNTGVPAGLALTVTASRTISADNALILGERIPSGGLVVSGTNVTIRNCWITSSFAQGGAASGTGVIKILPGASAVIEHCTLDGDNRTHAGLWHQGARMVARNNNIYGVNDGIFVWDADNFVIESNYLHGFTVESSNGHIDGFQTEGASHGLIRHNTFEITQPQNACIAIWNSRRDSDDILVQNNLMAGGGFCVYAHDYSPSDASPVGGFSVTNIRFINNVFSTVFYPYAGNWGAWFPRGAPSDGWYRSGNTILETGQNVDNSQPAGSFEGPADRTPPGAPATLTASPAGSAGVQLAWSAATDNVGVRNYRVERAPSGSEFPFVTVGVPASTVFSHDGLVAGVGYTYRVRAVDAAGNVSAPVSVAFSLGPPDAVPPSVNIIAPVSGAIVSNSVAFTASALDNVGIAGVQFLVDGEEVGSEISAPPFTLAWNSANASDGGHTLAAIARDFAGNATTSAAVHFVVSNETDAGLVAAYGFDEGMGRNIVDLSPFGNHGNLVNDAAWVAGKHGSALNFDGSGGWVQMLESPALDIVQGGTLMAWVRLSASNRWHGLIAKGDVNDNGETFNYAMEINAANRLVGVIGNGAAFDRVLSDSSVAVGEWVHLAFVWDGVALRAFVNTIPSGSAPQSIAPQTNAASLKLGCYGGNADFLEGSLDEVRIYDRALSQAEVSAAAVDQLPHPDGFFVAGIPAYWLVQYFGGTNQTHGAALDDWDQDGLNNLGEYLAGTVPTNALSTLAISSVQKLQSGTEIAFPTQIGRRYTLLYRDGLNGAAWQVVTTNVAGSGGEFHIIDSSIADQRVYRLAVELE